MLDLMLQLNNSQLCTYKPVHTVGQCVRKLKTAQKELWFGHIDQNCVRAYIQDPGPIYVLRTR